MENNEKITRITKESLRKQYELAYQDFNLAEDKYVDIAILELRRIEALYLDLYSEKILKWITPHWNREGSSLNALKKRAITALYLISVPIK